MSGCAAVLQTDHLSMASPREKIRPAIFRQCSPKAFTKLFHAMVQTCKIPESQMLQLHGLFSQSLKPVHAPCWNELVVTFWAFPPSEEAWSVTLDLLIKTLRPRLYTGADTNHGQKEILMVVPTNRLRSTPALLEQWMDSFADLIGMSAGVVCFGDYFGAQMLSSMMRITRGTRVFNNRTSIGDKDFSLLFSHLMTQRKTAERVLSYTGAHFTPETFIALHQDRTRLSQQNKQLSRKMEVMQSWDTNRLELLRIVQALNRTNAISMELSRQMLNLLAPVKLPENTSPELLNVLSAFSFVTISGEDQPVALPRPSPSEIPLQAPAPLLVDSEDSYRSAWVGVFGVAFGEAVD